MIRNGKAFLNIQCKLETGVRPTINIDSAKVLGIDRGIMNIVTASDNSFVNSKHLRNVKGRYMYLKAKLQSLGTPSARRKLKKISGGERRFTLNVNHVIAKKLVQKPYNVFAVEALKISKRKVNGRRFNRLLGSWSYRQLLSLLKYKAESAGKLVLQVNPRHTSQRCSKCGYTDKKNRKALRFKCLKCGFELNADLNAARNIAQLGTSELVQAAVNQPIVTQIAVTSQSPSGMGS
jgi:IS605 OrfB family transposase